MAIMVEKISAVTFRVSNMKASVQFYRDVLGMEVRYGGEGAFFSSLRAGEAESAILNLEQGKPVDGWGRLIFHVADVDAIWRRQLMPIRIAHVEMPLAPGNIPRLFRLESQFV